MHEVDLSKYRLRTDLIVEHLSNFKGYKKEEEQYKDIKVETITLDKDNAKLVSKKEGIYKTIYFEDVTDENNFNNLLHATTLALKDLLKSINIKDNYSALIVGLGNRKATPDALGPLTIDSIKITRQIVELGLPLDSKYRVISSLVPGVMGTTGIETKEIIEGVIEKTKPDFLIVIDALAASSLERINKTIQITDTGIHPGSGLLNNRFEISKETLGLPVIAIGIPTVVDATTIVSNTINYIFRHFSYEKENINNNKLKLVPPSSRDYKNHDKTLERREREEVMGLIGNLEEDEIKTLITEVLTPLGYNLLVTPKEIDFVIEKLSLLLSKALNKSLELN
ncbi:MAG TPA: GPR endopeptidase [Candidatus Onthousia excrementipullorum]|uniref:GPR endopeptidase n=1 Tax=Candidatus Onthousia excrementipullorum TaxID=2840884 RepID=A0A9D1DU18_9FIRM|nr:GPR endopeptidase [Candidatus Onthousia excrementipullorum]